MDHSYRERRDRVRRGLRETGADAAIAYPGPNLQYFTGFRGEPVDRFHVLCIPAEGEATLVTPRGYLAQANRNATVDSVRTVESNDPELVADALRSLVGDRPETVLVDDDAIHAVTGHLYEHLGGDVVDSAGPLFRSLRRRKDEAEITALRRSAEVADAVSREIRSLGADAVGMTETDLATEIRTELHRRGATGVSFDVVVGSGPNSAVPGLRYSDRTVESGDPVVVDFGCFLGGYASDQSRVVVFDGDPPSAYERVHEAVLAAQLGQLIRDVAPDDTRTDDDRTRRLGQALCGVHEFADKFTHGTGHGVGLASHERLAIAQGERTELEPGMVFSIEPGVYFEGEWGVRVEDLVVVTEDGSDRLNHSSRTWRPLSETGT